MVDSGLGRCSPEGVQMFFKTQTVYKVFLTRRGAENYIARWLQNQNAAIEVIDNKFYVVG